MAQLFPRIDEEATSQPEDYGRGQQPRAPAGPRPVHEAHADDGDGNGQEDGPRGASFQRLVCLAVRFFHLVRCVFVVRDDEVVAGLLHRVLQGFGRGL